MSMLHPRFNHLGRSKKVSHKTKEQKLADLVHEKFLLKYGVEPGRHRLKGVKKLDHQVNNW